jgi:hypothetical protein
MSSTSVSTVAAAAMTAGLLGALDAYASPAFIQVYSGLQPAPGGAAGTLVVEINLLRPAGAIVAGALQLAVPSAGGLALTAGAPTWGRLFDGYGNRFMDFKARLVTDVDDPLDPAALVITAATLEPGAVLRVVSGSINVGG